jgi:hypothetical protein
MNARPNKPNQQAKSMVKRLGSLATPMLLAMILKVLQDILKEIINSREATQEFHAETSEFMLYILSRHEKAERLKPMNFRNKTLDER